MYAIISSVLLWDSVITKYDAALLVALSGFPQLFDAECKTTLHLWYLRHLVAEFHLYLLGNLFHFIPSNSNGTVLCDSLHFIVINQSSFTTYIRLYKMHKNGECFRATALTLQWPDTGQSKICVKCV